MSEQGPTSPPVYTAVATTDDAEDNPPSYFDVVGQLKAAKAESKSNVDLLGKVVCVLFGSCIITIIMTICCAWQIAMVFIGLTYRYECFVQDKIPLWLIVYGATGIVVYALKLLDDVINFVKARKNEKSSNGGLRCIVNLLNLFLFIWFIIGNFWVYGVYDRVRYDKHMFPGNYCNWLCYRFAFWTITVTWMFFGFLCCCLCGCLLCVFGGIGFLAASSK